MFGKGKAKRSSNDHFVMAKGRAAGNLKAPMTGAPMKGQKPATPSPTYKARGVNKAPKARQM